MYIWSMGKCWFSDRMLERGEELLREARKALYQHGFDMIGYGIGFPFFLQTDEGQKRTDEFSAHSLHFVNVARHVHGTHGFPSYISIGVAGFEGGFEACQERPRSALLGGVHRVAVHPEADGRQDPDQEDHDQDFGQCKMLFHRTTFLVWVETFPYLEYNMPQTDFQKRNRKKS